jgi:CRISPR/Cas system CMR-associated protein Cmr5 small subunit
MAINNLEQKRLLYAMKESKGKNKDYGNMVKKVPAYIQKNGFPYTMAYLQGEKNGKAIFSTIYKWHCDNNVNVTNLISNASSETAFLEKILDDADGNLMRALTLETFSLMKSLRRFAKSDGDETAE